MLFGVPKQFELQSDSSPISEAEAVFITLTNQINPVQFDTSILADPRFKVLRDLKTPIFEEVTGRADPFGPLPGVKQQ